MGAHTTLRRRGTSSRTPWIPLYRPVISRAELAAVTHVLQSGHIGGNGPIGCHVEQRLSRRLHAKHVRLMTSCTHAFQTGLMALQIGRGDEVIMPSYAYMSMANAILNVGARPVFVDVEPAHLTIDPTAARRAVTRRTKAILAVHYAGYPCDMDALLAIKRQYRIALIEDAAQAIGSTYRGRMVGTIGDVGCLSFHETKNITCGEGGALVTQRTDIAACADIIREKGTNRSAFLRGNIPRYEWIAQGDNYVLSEIQAAILRAQLVKLEAVNVQHGQVGLRYLRALRPLETNGAIRLPGVHPTNHRIRYNWHLFFLLVQPPWRRDDVIAQLRRDRIQATFHFVALHTTPFGRQFHDGTPLPHAEAADRQLLRIPIYPGLRIAHQQRVIDALYQVFASRINR